MNQNLATTVVGTGGFNALTQRFTGDGNIDPVRVGASMLGAGFGSWAGSFAGQASNLGTYTAQQYALSKIGWAVEAPVTIISSGLNK